MADETPAPFWKKLVPKPSGSIPGGLLSQVAIGLIAVLTGALLVTHQFCGGGQPPPAAPAGQQEPVTGGGGLGRRISSMTEQQRRAKEHEERNRQRQEQIANQEMLSAGLGGATVSRDPRGPGAAAGFRSGGTPGAAAQGEHRFQTDAEFKLMEQLRLEDIERQRRSLRVGPVVYSRRGAAPAEAAAEEKENPSGPGPAADPAAASQAVLNEALGDFQSTMAAIAAAEQQPDPNNDTTAPPAVPATPAAAAGTYADPARMTDPLNPPGWERIYEGSFLEAALVTQLSGEFTGPVLAQVAVPFYSADRQRILVPRGTRAIGTAQAVGGQDQSRLAVGFHRLVFPDGRWVELTFDGLDQAGDAALKDKVNRHYLSMFAAVGAVGVLSGLTLRGSHPYAGGMAGFRAGAGQSIGQAGMQILSRFLNRHPTITIRAGHRLRIWFTSDVLVPRPPPKGGTR